MKFRLSYKDGNGKIVRGALLYPEQSRKLLDGMKDTLNKKHTDKHYFIETVYDEPERLQIGVFPNK